MNTCFTKVIAKIVDQHGLNWLCPKLQKAFLHIHTHPENFKTRLHSFEVLIDLLFSPPYFEVWDGDELVAGELGYQVGLIYTSLTGFYTKSGAGTVQLAALGKVLHSCQIKTWDFGMTMKYKLDLGSTRNFILCS